jgi:hypothetical protein
MPAAAKLEQAHNLAGGMDASSAEIDSSVPRYEE